MIFLIDYDRTSRATVRLDRFPDAERSKAQDERLKIELRLLEEGRLMEHEVVILGAIDEETVRKTHSRYFKHIPEAAAL